MSRRTGPTGGIALAAAAIAACCIACHSPQQSQRYFATAAEQDPMLEQLHETALYTVYFDHALRRCVLHSAHTWGENGGGGGGTGIGVAVFPCDPARLKARAADLRLAIEGGRALFLPTATPSDGAPAAAGGAGPSKGTTPPESLPGSGQ